MSKNEKMEYKKPKLEKYGDISVITKRGRRFGGDKDGEDASG